MSHAQPEFSPAGTPLPDRTVGELVAEQPGLSRVFQAHKLDFCCQGSRTLRQVCERKGLDLEQVVGDLEAAMAGPAEPTENPANLPPARLVEYIVEKHHGYLRQELPRLYAMSERVAQVHGGHTPSLIQLFQVFTGFAQQLATNAHKEESDIFPSILKSLAGGDHASVPEPAVTDAINEVRSTGETLVQLRELTGGYQPPPEACNTYRALFAGLSDLDNDLQRHIHLESNVLFPAVAQKAS